MELSKLSNVADPSGGFMSFLLACQLSERIAAVASIIGSMTPEVYNNPSSDTDTSITQND
jgi:polyhydroxybutyrate depolymerase